MKKKDRNWTTIAAGALSSIFRPNYFPLVAFALLVVFTYLSQLPWLFQLGLLLLVYAVTILMPAMGVYVYRRVRHLAPQDLLLHRNRIVPYVLHLIAYGLLLHFFTAIKAPNFMSGIVVISLLVQCACTVITFWWKISIHSAGVGAIMGALIAYAAIFHFNPLWWLCLAILVSGLVNSSRMLLRQHTLGQVMGGTLVGFLCGLVGLLI